eukprot:1681602-Pyramimonas_sp.AAC.2
MTAVEPRTWPASAFTRAWPLPSNTQQGHAVTCKSCRCSASCRRRARPALARPPRPPGPPAARAWPAP